MFLSKSKCWNSKIFFYFEPKLRHFWWNICSKFEHFVEHFFSNKPATLFCQNYPILWKGINRKQSTRWQHLSRLKASVFFSLQIFFCYHETQQLILGTGTAIWWLTEPHCRISIFLIKINFVQNFTFFCLKIYFVIITESKGPYSKGNLRTSYDRNWVGSPYCHRF